MPALIGYIDEEPVTKVRESHLIRVLAPTQVPSQKFQSLVMNAAVAEFVFLDARSNPINEKMKHKDQERPPDPWPTFQKEERG